MPGVVAKIIRIGNSQGIRIPKPILEQCGLRGEVILEPSEGRLVIRPAKPRQGWDRAFRAMAASGDDALLDPDGITWTSWDEDEWEWE
ncbi:AbrB/MazE/SpoVT family DNA-binding domain-containing protein [Deferrisoma palaeochoriense]